MVNHHVSPPFGEKNIFFQLFPSASNKQSQSKNLSSVPIIPSFSKKIHGEAEEINDQGVRIPPGANQLVVKTSNAAGTMDGPGAATSAACQLIEGGGGGS